jgi:hypothetical protein
MFTFRELVGVWMIGLMTGVSLMFLLSSLATHPAGRFVCPPGTVKVRAIDISEVCATATPVPLREVGNDK